MTRLAVTIAALAAITTVASAQAGFDAAPAEALAIYAVIGLAARVLGWGVASSPRVEPASSASGAGAFVQRDPATDATREHVRVERKSGARVQEVRDA